MRKGAPWLAVLLAALAVLAIVGCDDEDDGAAASPTAAPTPAAVVDPCTLRLSIDGQALAPGPSFALAAVRWQICVGGAAAGSSEKLLFRSDDAGATWTLLATTSLGNPTPEAGVGMIPNGNAAEALFFVDEQDGWLGLSSPGNNLFRTDDGGVTWTEVTALDPGLPVLAISFADPLNGSLTTPDGDWSTMDGGETWVAAP
jgi:photosystem II stability/assembly factor-like uncharacterized protein